MGAIRNLDRSLSIVRQVGGPLVGPAWLGGGLVAGALVLSYYVEAVEGAAALRGALAAVLLAAWGGRAVLLGKACRGAIVALFGDHVEVATPARVDVLRTAYAILTGLWLWLWIPLGVLWVGAAAVLFLPLLALRGAGAPGWIARAATLEGGGLATVRAAFEDNAGMRTSGALTELAILGATALVALNLFGVFALCLQAGRSFLGLDVALVESFLSPDNGFVVIVVVAGSAVLVEPLRVGWSVLAYTSARARREGFELRALVDRAIEGRRRARGGTGIAAALAVIVVFPGSVRADPAPLDAYAPTEEDRSVQESVQQILERPEFREVNDVRSRSLQRLIEDFFAWLSEQIDFPDLDLGPSEGGASLVLPDADVFLFGGLFLLVAVLVYLGVTRLSASRTDRSEDRELEGLTGDDPRERSPGAHLDEAAGLAAQGRHREALRSLYLATLVSLDRRRAITFDPTRTNWHYMRQMAPGEARDLFGRFTRLFDHKWYGDEPTSPEDYVRGRALADAICAPHGGGAEPS